MLALPAPAVAVPMVGAFGCLPFPEAIIPTRGIAIMHSNLQLVAKCMPMHHWINKLMLLLNMLL